MNDSQSDPKNSDTPTGDANDARAERAGQMRAERAVRSSNISLAEQRRSGRTMGFLGLSTVGHVAILLALAAVPAAVHEISGGDKPAGAGEVSMIDASGDPSAAATSSMANSQRDASVEVSVMTDEASDIAISPPAKAKPKVESAVIPLPEKKSVAEKSQPVKSRPEKKQPTKQKAPVQTAAAATPIMIEETQDAPPVLLANPPSDDEPTPVVAQAQAAEPKLEPVEEPATEVPDETAQREESKPVAAVVGKNSSSDDEANEKSEDAPPVALADSKTGATDESSSEYSSQKSAAVASKSSGEEAGQSGDGNGGAVGSVAGPIRDASELKALNGNPNPVYPPRDRLARKEGTAVILGRVSPDGRVVETTLEKSSGSSNMDAASVQAFRSWRFQAGQQGWVRKPFQFRLVGEAKEVPAPLGKGLKR